MSDGTQPDDNGTNDLATNDGTDAATNDDSRSDAGTDDNRSGTGTDDDTGTNTRRLVVGLAGLVLGLVLLFVGLTTLGQSSEPQLPPVTRVPRTAAPSGSGVGSTPANPPGSR